MKHQKIIPFYKKDKTRTSITLSAYQLQILDSLAEYFGTSRNNFLCELTEMANKEDKLNLSNYIKEKIIYRLVLLLGLKGIKL